MSVQIITDTLEGIPFKPDSALLELSYSSDASSVVAARKPIVAAIDGPAFGGALEIALVCSIICFDSFSQFCLITKSY